MKALILASGFCTRLYPITQYFPKALLTVAGREILAYTLDDLSKTGINDIALVTNERYFEIFRTYLTVKYPRLKIKCFSDGVQKPEDRIGAIGDICFSVKKLKWNDDLLVLSSNVVV